jgi:hypothetical protein
MNHKRNENCYEYGCWCLEPDEPDTLEVELAEARVDLHNLAVREREIMEALEAAYNTNNPAYIKYAVLGIITEYNAEGR